MGCSHKRMNHSRHAMTIPATAPWLVILLPEGEAVPVGLEAEPVTVALEPEPTVVRPEAVVVLLPWWCVLLLSSSSSLSVSLSSWSWSSL